MTLRPFAFKIAEELTLKWCKEQGWFSEKEHKDITDEDRQHPYWQNNWQMAASAVVFYEESFNY